MEIKKIHAREVLDSRGNPTIEVEVFTKSQMGRAIVPSGASTGVHEALELRDGGKRFLGKGVQTAVGNVNNTLSKKLIGFRVDEQEKLDQKMIELDGTSNKSKLGANAILGVSMAAARAAALERGEPLHKYLGNSRTLPIPFCNIINGGKHAGGKLEMQEFMVAPVKASSFAEATMIASETYHTLKDIIAKKYGKSAVNVGDEGGFAPNIDSAEKALDLITDAMEKTGYAKKVRIAMDPASSEFYHDDRYLTENLTREKMAEYYDRLVKNYPIISIEDLFEQDDFVAYKIFMENYQPKNKIQVVGDDLLVSNLERIKTIEKMKLCNALLLKVNQIGSLSEAMNAAKHCMKSNWGVMVSHRSGESEDPFIADLAVGLGSGQIKLGAPCRSDRTSKFNQLIRIEEELGNKAKYPKDMFR